MNTTSHTLTPEESRNQLIFYILYFVCFVSIFLCDLCRTQCKATLKLCIRCSRRCRTSLSNADAQQTQPRASPSIEIQQLPTQ